MNTSESPDHSSRNSRWCKVAVLALAGTAMLGLSGCVDDDEHYGHHYTYGRTYAPARAVVSYDSPYYNDYDSGYYGSGYYGSSVVIGGPRYYGSRGYGYGSRYGYGSHYGNGYYGDRNRSYYSGNRSGSYRSSSGRTYASNSTYAGRSQANYRQGTTTHRQGTGTYRQGTGSAYRQNVGTYRGQTVSANAGRGGVAVKQGSGKKGNRNHD
jgi:hypothetical protein